MKMVGSCGSDSDARASALNSFKIETSLDLNIGRIEVRHYSWDHPHADAWQSDAYYLHFCLSPRPGKAWAIYQDTDRRVSTEIGQLMFVPPGRSVHSGGAMGTQRSLSFELTPGFVENILGRSPTWHDEALFEGLHIRNPDVEWLLLKLYRELRQPGASLPIMAEVLASAAVVALVRQLKLDRRQPPHGRGGLAPWRMRIIRERVYGDQAAPQLGELAELCGMSTRHLIRAFKEETGMTVAEYVKQATIERAKLMLSDSRVRIGDIVERLGFSSSASFAYAFRRSTGCRPTEYRAMSATQRQTS